MRYITVLLLLLFYSNFTKAQETNSQDSIKHWHKGGKAMLLFNQSSFNNWISGGQSNAAGTLNLNYDFNYKKENLTWDTKVIASYGLTKTKGETFTKKTDDRLEINSLFGIKTKGFWYYSAFINFKTQFTRGYEFSDDVLGNEIRIEKTHFLSPAYLQFGPGLLWEKSNNIKLNFAPVAAKIIMVDKDFTLPNAAYFGVDEGKSTRFELGFNTGIFYKLDLMENVSVENIVNLYSNYLEDSGNIDIDYTMNLVMTINKYLSANLIFQTIYDDNSFKGFQVREVFGISINYNL